MWQKCERDVQKYNENCIFFGLLINFRLLDFADLQRARGKTD